MSERWLWVARDRAGDAVGSGPEFSSQAEAETWLTEHWRSLRDAGGMSVTLLRGEAAVYDMSLEES
jgi:hypothetical protein